MRTTIRGWFGGLIEIVGITVAVSLWTSPSAAQTPHPLAHATDVWAALSLGFADLGQHGGLAGQLALSRTVEPMVIILRAAGAGEFGEVATDRGYADVALLAEKRTARPQIPGPENVAGTAASLSLGLAWLHFSQPSSSGSPGSSGAVPAIAFAADFMAHLRVIGLGVSLFGASGFKDRYLGAGLTLGVGRIH